MKDDENQQDSQKYKAFCLSLNNRVDSASLAAKERASTPTKADETVARLNEVSMCSTIMQPNDTTVIHQVNETVAAAGNATGLNATSLLGKIWGYPFLHFVNSTSIYCSNQHSV